MGRHSKPSKVKKIAKNSALSAASLGAVAGIATAAAPVASAFPGQDGLIQCESGGNPHAVNGSNPNRPAGLFQIITSTWRAFGGAAFAPTADLASAAQQQTVADRIYAAQGSSPWACHTSGGNHPLGGAVAPAVPKALVPVAPKVFTPPPAPSPAPKHAPAPGRHYIVQAGDSLWRIAGITYGSGTDWPHLYEVNKSLLGGNPNLIFPGQDLTL